MMQGALASSGHLPHFEAGDRVQATLFRTFKISRGTVTDDSSMTESKVKVIWDDDARKAMQESNVKPEDYVTVVNLHTCRLKPYKFQAHDRIKEWVASNFHWVAEANDSDDTHGTYSLVLSK